MPPLAAALPPPPAAVAPHVPGVLGAGAVAAGGAGVLPVAGPSMCWVCVELGGGYQKGEIVVHEPGALPAGHVLLGDRGVIPAKDGSSSPVFVRRVKVDEAPNYKLDDLRVLPIHFDGQGVRRVDFAKAVTLMVDGVPQGGGLQLEGPATALNIVQGLQRPIHDSHVVS